MTLCCIRSTSRMRVKLSQLSMPVTGGGCTASGWHGRHGEREICRACVRRERMPDWLCGGGQSLSRRPATKRVSRPIQGRSAATIWPGHQGDDRQSDQQNDKMATSPARFLQECCAARMLLDLMMLIEQAGGDQVLLRKAAVRMLPYQAGLRVQVTSVTATSASSTRIGPGSRPNCASTLSALRP